ncbi:P-loop NTPase fold protein [Ancylomarina sp. 16SWW S1-10-2]|uniref:P-loop NTPase fold protein n=1 Tax=Ancylomarina sp. 16SWW S1-10-2 TaxID=2499681 RepID=UPI0012AD8F40|nr:P-loop NTPase fold protein [Ancylomarina sp. 16SWW S1-10-2]MRT91774.1 hypothetical protein [Ancylomarina sp. 16SWW S1-10-2]
MAEDLIQVAEEISLEPEIKVIPIDKSLLDFYNHLSYNERIIFSAKFGDGKTYFLNKFFEEHKDEFEAIRIFPVNYQVADNKDIFELIKKDILIHLLANDLIEDEDFFDESIYAQNYLFNNGADIILDILSDVPAVKVPAKIIQKSLKHLKKYKDDKTDFKASKSELIEKYLSKFEQETGVAEYDSISELITRIIKAIQKKGKKVVLVIDDLDRIDPAHLFRILNVLTAHIDRKVVLLKEIEVGVGNNKFNFDHIITVFDIENVRTIFHHLYGSGTDFNGYITKFVTRQEFKYTLEQISYDFVNASLSALFQIPKEFLLNMKPVKAAIERLSIREKVRLITNIDEEIIDVNLVNKDVQISSVNSFTRFLVILKRLNLNFISVSSPLYGGNLNHFMSIIGVAMYFSENCNIGTDIINIPTSKGASSYTRIAINKHIVGDLVVNLTFDNIDVRNSGDVLYDELKILNQKFSAYIKA